MASLMGPPALPVLAVDRRDALEMLPIEAPQGGERRLSLRFERRPPAFSAQQLSRRLDREVEPVAVEPLHLL